MRLMTGRQMRVPLIFVWSSPWMTLRTISTPLSSSPWMAAVRKTRGPSSAPRITVTGMFTGLAV